MSNALILFVNLPLIFYLAYEMDVIQTKYKSEDDYSDDDGITFKEQMVNNSQLKEMTICARINLDYFSAKQKYVRIFRLSDGNKMEKVYDFRLRLFMSSHIRIFIKICKCLKGPGDKSKLA